LATGREAGGRFGRVATDNCIKKAIFEIGRFEHDGIERSLLRWGASSVHETTDLQRKFVWGTQSYQRCHVSHCHRQRGVFRDRLLHTLAHIFGVERGFVRQALEGQIGEKVLLPCCRIVTDRRRINRNRA